MGCSSFRTHTHLSRSNLCLFHGKAQRRCSNGIDNSSLEPFPSENWDRDCGEVFFECLANHLKLRDKSEWHRITKTDVANFGGESMLKKLHNGSVMRALQKVHPNHKWSPWEFGEYMPRGQWTAQLERDFVEHLARRLKVTKMEDWYQISKAQIYSEGGGILLHRYHNSPSKMITSVLTQHNWKSRRFRNRSLNTWDDVQLQKDFVHRLSKELKITCLSDWYNVSQTQIRERGGSGLLEKYHNSVSQMIIAIIPGHDWNLDQFVCWSQRDSLQKIAKKLGITQMEDWYTVTKAHIYHAGGGTLLQKYQNSPIKMITSILAEHKWDVDKFNTKSKKEIK